MADSIFVALEDNLFEPTEHARGPWDAQALHGGAPAALVASAFERMQPGAEMAMAQLRFEFLRPIPFAPLRLRTEIVRSGRRVQELSAQLSADDQIVCRAGALRIQPTPEGLPSAGAEPSCASSLAPPETGTSQAFALSGDPRASFATTGMEMSWLGEPGELGPSRVWMRVRLPLLADQHASPLASVTATADFGNGIGAELPFEEHLFINADLTIQLWQRPRGEWVGLDARTLLRAGAPATAESVLHDERGPVGRAFQALVVQPR